MRLWHYKLLPFLPKSQLIAQWRELNSIFKNKPNHILIEYVYGRPSDLKAYAYKVIAEFDRRGYAIKSFSNMNNYFSGKVIIGIADPFPDIHNRRYLLQCFYNLQEKYDRGQKDFSKLEYDALVEFVNQKENRK